MKDALVGFSSPSANGLTYNVSQYKISPMSIITVSSKGQIVLPADVRRRLGMGAGSKIELIEDGDGLRLRVMHPVNRSDLTKLAGMVTAPSRGVPRTLEDFDPAATLRRSSKI